MAAASTAKPAAAASETPVVEEAVAAAEPIVEREFEVVRDFASHVGTQLLRFAKGEIVPSHPGEHLYSVGAPLKPLA